jgi:glutathione peroxidase
MKFYDLEAKTSTGDPLFFSELKGHVVLIVNTATKCGFTPQFHGLQKLHEKYHDKGLVVIGFPCNQFLNQEPVSNTTMEEVCRINYGITFQLTEKIDVNGGNEHPVFHYLKSELRGILGKRIKWNFTKFLISAEGKPIKRYSPSKKPKKIGEDIKRLLMS